MDWLKEVFAPSAVGVLFGSALPLVFGLIKDKAARADALRASRLQVATELSDAIANQRRAMTLDGIEFRMKTEVPPEANSRPRTIYGHPLHETEAQSKLNSAWSKMILHSSNLSGESTKRATQTAELSTTFELMVETMRHAGMDGISFLPGMLAAWTQTGEIDFEGLAAIREILPERIAKAREASKFMGQPRPDKPEPSSSDPTSIEED